MIEDPKVKVTFLDADKTINNNRYLILLHSDYFDSISGDDRGVLSIPTKKEYKREAKEKGYAEDQLLLDDIQTSVNAGVVEAFPEISEEVLKRNEMVEKLKKEYLLTDEALNDVKNSDSVEDILTKAYTFDAKRQAKLDAAYNESLLKLDHLDTTRPEYQEKLSDVVDELIKDTPLKNRTALSRYVARRSMIIELLGKVLERKLESQKDGRDVDEKILHNLIFSQHSDPMKVIYGCSLRNLCISRGFLSIS